MTELLPALGAALLTGLLGSAHCFGMCGGLSGLFAVNASVASLRPQFSMAFTYNLGRVLSYAFLGAVVALVGQAFVALQRAGDEFFKCAFIERLQGDDATARPQRRVDFE